MKSEKEIESQFLHLDIKILGNEEIAANMKMKMKMKYEIWNDLHYNSTLLNPALLNPTF